MLWIGLAGVIRPLASLADTLRGMPGVELSFAEA
jgi:hypothetical protein